MAEPRTAAVGRSRPAPDTALYLDEAVVSRGVALLHAQCWLWGQDLKSPQGDLLTACGLARSVFDGARSHRSYYGGRLSDARFVVAWGGGLVFGDATGALFFPRLRFAPTRLDNVRSLEAVPDLNAVHEAAPLAPPRDNRLVLAALEWLAVYEDEVTRIAGPRWRAECARRWAEIEEGARTAAASVSVAYEKLPPIPPDGLAESWRELAASIPARGPSPD
ncbi:MAG: hypothetical protein R3C39_12780 [Dehalococcoidia bacterium]